jgi:hypothetical protein
LRGKWFVGAVSDGKLINASYIQSLARGGSSNDEAQAWCSGVKWNGMEESRLIAGTALSVVETWRKE